MLFGPVVCWLIGEAGSAVPADGTLCVGSVLGRLERGALGDAGPVSVVAATSGVPVEVLPTSPGADGVWLGAVVPVVSGARCRLMGELGSALAGEGTCCAPAAFGTGPP